VELQQIVTLVPAQSATTTPAFQAATNHVRVAAIALLSWVVQSALILCVRQEAATASVLWTVTAWDRATAHTVSTFSAVPLVVLPAPTTPSAMVP
jgi:hypothetical protein